jgi:hypothetical protein
MYQACWLCLSSSKKYLLKFPSLIDLSLHKKMYRKMMIDSIFEQLKNDKIKWAVTKTNKNNCLVLGLEKVFLGYSGTPESNHLCG